jgi:4-hydroxybenzoate polyprenyltransferase
VISNVWVGIVIATMAVFSLGVEGYFDGHFWIRVARICLAGVFLYISGNFFNDLHDVEWDRKNRPERALPRGLFTPLSYLMIGITLAIAALAIAFTLHPHSGWVAVAILVFILIYTRWHKRTAWMVIPMGICRALLPAMGFFAFSSPPSAHDTYSVLFSPLIGVQSLALLLYIAGLSLSARYESSPNPSVPALIGSRALLVSSGLLVAGVWWRLVDFHVAAGLFPFLLWMTLSLTRYRRPIPAHVSALLAGIPLIDWIGLLGFALVLSGKGATDPFILACILVAPLAFVSGRALQRLAPAT